MSRSRFLLQFVLVASFFLALYTLVDELKRRRSRKMGSRMGHRAGEESTGRIFPVSRLHVVHAWPSNSVFLFCHSNVRTR